jgi:hypothetical protein
MMPTMAMSDPICIIVHVDQYSDIKFSPSQNCSARRAKVSMTTMTVDTRTHPRHKRM